MLPTNKFNMVCQISDVLYIHPLPYLSDPTYPITCLRPHLIFISTSFEVATPGLGTPGLVVSKLTEKCQKLAMLRKSKLLKWLLNKNFMKQFNHIKVCGLEYFGCNLWNNLSCYFTKSDHS